MMGRRIALISALLVVLAGSAVAGAFAARPEALLLRKSDFPAAAKYNWGQLPANVVDALKGIGVDASGAYLTVTIPAGGPTKYESISGLVLTTASAAQAKTAYAAFLEDLQRRSTSELRLPAYGEQQLALYHSPKYGSKIELLVRRNRVVWQLEVAGEGLLALPKPTLLAELEKYAEKQQSRVASG
jgi:hypothetical protein